MIYNNKVGKENKQILGYKLLQAENITWTTEKFFVSSKATTQANQAQLL